MKKFLLAALVALAFVSPVFAEEKAAAPAAPAAPAAASGPANSSVPATAANHGLANSRNRRTFRPISGPPAGFGVSPAFIVPCGEHRAWTR